MVKDETIVIVRELTRVRNLPAFTIQFSSSHKRTEEIYTCNVPFFFCSQCPHNFFPTWLIIRIGGKRWMNYRWCGFKSETLALTLFRDRLDGKKVDADGNLSWGRDVVPHDRSIVLWWKTVWCSLYASDICQCQGEKEGVWPCIVV